MNHVVTSRKQLLEAAREIAADQGISGVNIRAVAAKCGISVGALYNYFPTKTELIVAVIEDFWLAAAKNMEMEGERISFPVCFEAVFYRLQNYLSKFQENWIAQISLLGRKERELGRRREADYFGAIRRMFVRGLEQDPQIPPQLWTAEFTREQFADFALDNLLGILKQGGDCGYFLLLLRKLLYPQFDLS